jgi:dTDP-4-dehydrorhamnose 3,5-epimerase-like enzyme
MVDSMEQYSKPLKVEETKLGIKYWLNPRRTKPGRELIVTYDQRFPLIDFPLKYSHFVRFLNKGSVAGNHYHKEKQEIYVPVDGEFEVHLEDPITKEKEVINLNASDVVALYIKKKVSHKVVSKNDKGVLLVFASSPIKDDDDIEYKVD